MKTWIRWKGILAFVLILVLLIVFFKFYAGTLVKKTIEFAGTQAVGAKVDLADADLSLFPLGITLSGLQVTDPDEPMTNLFEVSKARFSLEPGALLLRKVIIDRMAVEDLRLKTARQTSGEIVKQEKPKPEVKTSSPSGDEKPWTLPTFDVADVKAVLAKEPLDIVREGEILKRDLAKTRTDFETRFMALPDKETFEVYEDRFKELKSGKIKLNNILGKAEDLKKLKKDVEKDVEKIKTMRKDLKRAVSEYESRIKKLPDMALSDVRRLKDKYTLSPQGMGNMSALFFGQKSSAWVTKGLTWYQTLKPYLRKDPSVATPETEAPEPQTVRGHGVDVAFREKNPLPGFLLKHADLSLNLDAGMMNGTLEQVTREQNLTGQPVSMGLTATQLKTLSAFKLVGIMDRVKENEDKDQLMISAKGLKIDGMALAEGSPLGVRLEKTLADAEMNLRITDGQLDGTCNIALGPMALTPVDAGKSDRLSQALAKALADVTSLTVRATLSGTVDHYSLALNSDLDRVLKNAMEGIIADLSAEFSKELSEALDAKAQEQVEGLTGNLDLFSNLDHELEKRLDVGRETLKGF